MKAIGTVMPLVPRPWVSFLPVASDGITLIVYIDIATSTIYPHTYHRVRSRKHRDLDLASGLEGNQFQVRRLPN